MIQGRKFKRMTDALRGRTAINIIMLLLASRDCYANRKEEVAGFKINDSYYTEAFGILRGLNIAGYGYFDADNWPADPDNFKWWFGKLCDEALRVEALYGLKPALHNFRALASSNVSVYNVGLIEREGRE